MHNVIGIDLGGTKISAARVHAANVQQLVTQPITAANHLTQIMEQIFAVINALLNSRTKAIGIGIPGLIDVEQQLVYDLVNIPALNELPLQKILADKYQLPVEINNDANCFAIGEYHFGQGNSVASMVGITLGTGMGTGIVINGQLYSGAHVGAGEFGMINYRNHTYEYYTSGSFFNNVYHIAGQQVYTMALKGDTAALHMYNVYGTHVGNAIQTILFAIDPQVIILGGSAAKAWPFFKQAMWASINTYAYQRSLRNLHIATSHLQNSGVLGAAALCHMHL